MMAAASLHSDDVPVPWRLRRDLEIQPSSFGSGPGWIIKDPVKLSYFHAEGEEMEFLRRLDGRTSLRKICTELERSFPLTEFSLRNLRLFLLSAVNGGLLAACRPGHGSRLASVLAQRRSAMVGRKLLSLLTWRFRGIDPTWILDYLHRLTFWIFRPVSLWMCAGFIVTVFVLVLSRWSQLLAELPNMVQLASIDHLAVLAVAVVLIKFLHELGHGVACRHYGGECHELGVLLVAFFPLLYCDVSDSWLQRDRRRRMLVTGAGIAVELLLAAICGLLWMLSHPGAGALHTFFLNVMLICSLNTVMINGNPLLRYDGYYLLADLLAIPNLASEARLAARTLSDQIVLGIPRPIRRVRTNAAEAGMILFGVASFLYRYVVLGSLLWVLHQVLKPHGLELLTLVMAASIGSAILLASLGGIRRRWMELRAAGAGIRRAAGGLLTVSLLLGAVLLTPWSHRISVPFVMSSGISTPVFARSAGSLHVEIPAGSAVEEGEILARLSNADLELAVERAAADLRLARTRVAILEGQRLQLSGLSSALPGAEEDVEAARRRLDALHRRREELVIRSPATGQLFPPRNVPETLPQSRTQGKWFGVPLDHRNQTAWIEEQTLLGSVGRAADLRALCMVPQHQIDLVQLRAGVVLKCTSAPARTVPGTVMQLNSAPEKRLARELQINRLLPVSPRDADAPLHTLFAVHVQPDSADWAILPPLYSTGYAEIECPPMSVLQRLWRLLCHTFSFRM